MNLCVDLGDDTEFDTPNDLLPALAIYPAGNGSLTGPRLVLRFDNDETIARLIETLEKVRSPQTVAVVTLHELTPPCGRGPVHDGACGLT